MEAGDTSVKNIDIHNIVNDKTRSQKKFERPSPKISEITDTHDDDFVDDPEVPPLE